MDEVFAELMEESQRKTRVPESLEAVHEVQKEGEMHRFQEILIVAKDNVAVARESVAVAKVSITMAKKNMEKDREMQRQLMDAILSQNAFLQNMLLLGQRLCSPVI